MRSYDTGICNVTLVSRGTIINAATVPVCSQTAGRFSTAYILVRTPHCRRLLTCTTHPNFHGYPLSSTHTSTHLNTQLCEHLRDGARLVGVPHAVLVVHAAALAACTARAQLGGGTRGDKDTTAV